MAPGDGEQAFYLMSKAFNLAERYQTPVIVLGDQHLNDCYYTLEDLDLDRIVIDRSSVVSDDQIPSSSEFRRYLWDDLLASRGKLGEYLPGAVINAVPEHRLDFVRKEVQPFVERRGIRVFGVVPREGILISVSVRELAEGVRGEILCTEGALEELVEHLVVGALSADSALTYFRRKPNKAVIRRTGYIALESGYAGGAEELMIPESPATVETLWARLKRALSVETTLSHTSPAVVMVPTQSGTTARSIARFRLPVWITAVGTLESTCQNLQFSYGVHPVHVPEHPEDWKTFARGWLRDHGVTGDLVILTEGPSSRHPETNHRMEIIDLRPATPR